MIAADQFVTFSLPEWQYDSACPVLGEIFSVPDLIDDGRQPPNDIIATGFKHFRRNLADARGSVIFQKLHSLFYLIHGYWIGGALQRWLSGEALPSNLFTPWKNLLGIVENYWK